MSDEKMLQFILERFAIEKEKKDRSGIYAFTQRTLAYNSNKIEGSTLTEEQTAALFDSGILPQTDDYYRAKDVEEMNGHFLMFNKMLDTIREPLSQELVKAFHYELKSGVFEDRANGYAIGEYKKRPNMIGIYETVSPKDVEREMANLLEWYAQQEVDIRVLAEFHARYEAIHPFQDGNGRTGRLILFRESLTHGMMPPILEDRNRNEYIAGLKKYREEKNIEVLEKLLRTEQEFYRQKCQYFLPDK